MPIVHCLYIFKRWFQDQSIADTSHYSTVNVQQRMGREHHGWLDGKWKDGHS